MHESAIAEGSAQQSLNAPENTVVLVAVNEFIINFSHDGRKMIGSGVIFFRVFVNAMFDNDDGRAIMSPGPCSENLFFNALNVDAEQLTLGSDVREGVENLVHRHCLNKDLPPHLFGPSRHK